MGAVVMVFTGEYDLSHKARLRAELEALRDEAHLVLDFSDVTYIDSTCISELMRMQDHRAKRQLNRVAIVQTAPSVRRLFDILDMASMFNVVASLDETLPRDGQSCIVQYASPGDDTVLSPSDVRVTLENGSTDGVINKGRFVS
jgi:anti-anti-sigma factor